MKFSNLFVSLVPAIAISLSLAACATGTNKQEEAVDDSKYFVTGSNIPQRDRSQIRTMSKEDAETAIRNSYKSPMKPGGG